MFRGQPEGHSGKITGRVELLIRHLLGEPTEAEVEVRYLELGRRIFAPRPTLTRPKRQSTSENPSTDAPHHRLDRFGSAR